MTRSAKNTVPAETPGPAVSPAEDLRERILDYLATHNSMTIASCRKNVPWAAAVFYVNDGFDLYFFSSPRSRHGMNMAANAIVSAAIHEDYGDWKEIRGIQLQGRAERVRSPKLQVRFWEMYRQKFTFVDAFFRPGALHDLVKAKITAVRVYRIAPQAIWYLDNSRGFGHREMLEL